MKPTEAAAEAANEHRVKIQNSNILNALIEHAEERREMSSTQVTAVDLMTAVFDAGFGGGFDDAGFGGFDAAPAMRRGVS